MPEVALVYTHTTNVTAVFMNAVVQNVLLDDENRALIGNNVHAQAGGIIASVRNRAVEWFLEHTSVPWLWFLDADMGAGSYTLPDLLAAADGPCVVSAATWAMSPDGRKLTWARKQEDGSFQWVRDIEGHRVEIDGCGGACTIIHREVLEAVKARHPDDPWHWFGHDLVDGQRFGEDYTFCFRVQSVGYKIFGVDTLVPHYKLMPL